MFLCLFSNLLYFLTAVIRRDYLHYVKKYNRFEKRHKNISVHLSPCFRDTAIGDTLTVGECRPLSKTVKYNTLKVSKSARSKKAFSKFYLTLDAVPSSIINLGP